MTEVVILALIAQIGTLLTVILTAIVGRKKLNDVHDLVNGQSSRQMETIERQGAKIDGLQTALQNRRKPGRPRKEVE